MEMQKEKVSLIIAMYNCERYIVRCLDSIINQSYREIEVLVVDDGSSDHSAEIVKEMADRDKRIRYIHQTNSGPGAARNRAAAEAVGKYITFVDGDDYIGADYIKDMVSTAERNKAQLVLAGYTLVYENGKKVKPVIPEYYIQGKREEWLYRISSCCGRLYLKEFWDKHGMAFQEEKEARAEDVPVALYANAMAENISIVKNPEYFYYQHSGSAMNDLAKKIIFRFPYKEFRKVYDELENVQLTNSREFLDFGILKFLAQFEFVIYRNADKKEKEFFCRYVRDLLKEDFGRMEKNWKKIKRNIELPITHRAAIGLFILKYKDR